MRRFDINKLPVDVLEKIYDIYWNDGETFDEDTLGEVWLEDEYVFEFDGSHCTTFDSRKELIDVVRTCVIEL